MAKRKITHEGEIVPGSNRIPCYVLDDGTRVLSARGMQDALKMVGETEPGKLTIDFDKVEQEINQE